MVFPLESGNLLAPTHFQFSRFSLCKQREVVSHLEIKCGHVGLIVHVSVCVLVVDVYQAWCGPCKAVVTLFRKLKNEYGEDDLLHFAVVRT